MTLKASMAIGALLAALTLSFVAGQRWQSAATAKELAQAMDQQVQLLGELAGALAEQAVDSAIAYDQAAERLDTIATQLEADREANRNQFRAQAKELATLLAERPDLADQHLGADVLQHWNRSNARPGTSPATTPAAQPAGKPAAAMPGAATGQQRPRGLSAGQPRRRGSAVPRLREPQSGLAGHGGGVAGHRMALVLRGAAAVRAGGRRTVSA